jgi:hypothetical protein
MLLLEFFHQDPKGFQDVEDDNSQLQLGDMRKTKLTLRQINKLRRMNDVRTFEYKEKLKDVRKQYSPPPQPMM